MLFPSLKELLLFSRLGFLVVTFCMLSVWLHVLMLIPPISRTCSNKRHIQEIKFKRTLDFS